MRRGAWWLPRAGLVVILTSCVGSGGTPLDPGAPPVTGDPVVYVAIGASETVGVGTDDPLSQAWPKVLWHSALPEAVFYDLGRSGSTLAEALTEQAGAAEALRPSVVTVWLNVNDLVARVPVATYRRELATLLDGLTAGGATVLVATTPRIDGLPVYRACRPDPPLGGPGCPVGAILPPPTQVRALVDAYNMAIRDEAARAGAIVVDLQAFGNAPVEHPDWVAADGFHPSTAGARAVAKAFAAQLPVALTTAAAAPR